MNVIRNKTQGLLVAETEKSYRVRTISTEANWWPKAQCRIDFDFYQAQLAMHLLAGYGTENDSIDGIAKLSAFVPALILADRKLEAQLEAGRDDWTRVFAYDVAQASGVWLAANPNADVAAFTEHLETLVA